MPGGTRKVVCIDCGEYKFFQAKKRCARCYDQYRIKTRKPKPCSQCDKTHVLIKKGLCPKCYKQDWNKKNRDHVNDYNYAWDTAHPERRNASKRRYAKTEKYQATVTAKNHARLKRLNEAPGNGLTAKEWIEIKEAHNRSCYYCGRKMKRLEVEHKTPLSRGGAHDPTNIVPSCMKCNREKGPLTEKEFALKRAG